MFSHRPVHLLPCPAVAPVPARGRHLPRGLLAVRALFERRRPPVPRRRVERVESAIRRAAAPAPRGSRLSDEARDFVAETVALRDLVLTRPHGVRRGAAPGAPPVVRDDPRGARGAEAQTPPRLRVAAEVGLDPALGVGQQTRGGGPKRRHAVRRTHDQVPRGRFGVVPAVQVVRGCDARVESGNRGVRVFWVRREARERSFRRARSREDTRKHESVFVNAPRTRLCRCVVSDPRLFANPSYARLFDETATCRAPTEGRRIAWTCLWPDPRDG